ncbi:MAG TPA: polyprenyl diphosphate synthase [Acidocella sp.]|jgi:undecaprenyl diphosphate synthase|uniref:polyprenyl diphosphate synthase n=1 Tax=Acidocella sp. TaxID=50710 RepID=UPI002C6AB291|nr:polyprenyl diphosphate synthase [Acidocella sp.]HVE20365.1 polyprenyl diphosphate synthase [Acidocella sp.]
MADLSSRPIPLHIAIIMDGNGRWAAARGVPRVAGHREGARAVRRTIEAAVAHGVRYLTLFAFSSENWRRPAGEVADLTFLMKHYLRSELAELHEQGVCLKVIGERERFGPNLTAELAAAEAKTAGNTRLTLVMALSYGGRADIVAAARRVIGAGLAPEALNEQIFARYLSTDGIPDPDLLIRTSGEERISNFLLWQLAYAEMFFTDVLWPDFGADEFARALAEYATRERRFGARPA